LNNIHRSTSKDHNAIWAILQPTFRAGDTYAQPTDIFREEALSYWLGGHHTGYIAVEDNQTLGTYYLTPNADALKIWSDNGFTEVGRLPNAFNHPTEGFVDALILYKTL